MSVTPNYNWPLIEPTDFVTNLPADFEVFADAVDADLAGLLGGTTGQVLAKDSATDHDFGWQTISGGGMTEIASGTLTGTLIDITSIAGTFNELWLYINGLSLVGGNASWGVQFNGITTASSYLLSGISRGSSSVLGNTSNFWQPNTITGGLDNTGDDNTAVLRFPNYASSASFKFIEFTAAGTLHSGPTDEFFSGGGAHYSTTAAITSIQLVAASGFDAGTYALYGVK